MNPATLSTITPLIHAANHQLHIEQKAAAAENPQAPQPHSQAPRLLTRQEWLSTEFMTLSAADSESLHKLVNVEITTFTPNLSPDSRTPQWKFDQYARDGLPLSKKPLTFPLKRLIDFLKEELRGMAYPHAFLTGGAAMHLLNNEVDFSDRDIAFFINGRHYFDTVKWAFAKFIIFELTGKTVVIEHYGAEYKDFLINLYFHKFLPPDDTVPYFSPIASFIKASDADFKFLLMDETYFQSNLCSVEGPFVNLDTNRVFFQDGGQPCDQAGFDYAYQNLSALRFPVKFSAKLRKAIFRVMMRATQGLMPMHQPVDGKVPERSLMYLTLQEMHNNPETTIENGKFVKTLVEHLNDHFSGNVLGSTLYGLNLIHVLQEMTDDILRLRYAQTVINIIIERLGKKDPLQEFWKFVKENPTQAPMIIQFLQGLFVYAWLLKIEGFKAYPCSGQFEIRFNVKVPGKKRNHLLLPHVSIWKILTGFLASWDKVADLCINKKRDIDALFSAFGLGKITISKLERKALIKELILETESAQDLPQNVEDLEEFLQTTKLFTPEKIELKISIEKLKAWIRRPGITAQQKETVKAVLRSVGKEPKLLHEALKEANKCIPHEILVTCAPMWKILLKSDDEDIVLPAYEFLSNCYSVPANDNHNALQQIAGSLTFKMQKISGKLKAPDPTTNEEIFAHHSLFLLLTSAHLATDKQVAWDLFEQHLDKIIKEPVNSSSHEVVAINAVNLLRKEIFLSKDPNKLLNQFLVLISFLFPMQGNAIGQYKSAQDLSMHLFKALMSKFSDADSQTTLRMFLIKGMGRVLCLKDAEKAQSNFATLFDHFCLLPDSHQIFSAEIEQLQNLLKSSKFDAVASLVSLLEISKKVNADCHNLLASHIQDEFPIAAIRIIDNPAQALMLWKKHHLSDLPAEQQLPLASALFNKIIEHNPGEEVWAEIDELFNAYLESLKNAHPKGILNVVCKSIKLLDPHAHPKSLVMQTKLFLAIKTQLKPELAQNINKRLLQRYMQAQQTAPDVIVQYHVNSICKPERTQAETDLAMQAITLCLQNGTDSGYVIAIESFLKLVAADVASGPVSLILSLLDPAQLNRINEQKKSVALFVQALIQKEILVKQFSPAEREQLFRSLLAIDRKGLYPEMWEQLLNLMSTHFKEELLSFSQLLCHAGVPAHIELLMNSIPPQSDLRKLFTPIGGFCEMIVAGMQKVKEDKVLLVPLIRQVMKEQQQLRKSYNALIVLFHEAVSLSNDPAHFEAFFRVALMSNFLVPKEPGKITKQQHKCFSYAIKYIWNLTQSQAGIAEIVKNKASLTAVIQIILSNDRNHFFARELDNLETYSNALYQLLEVLICVGDAADLLTAFSFYNGAINDVLTKKMRYDIIRFGNIFLKVLDACLQKFPEVLDDMMTQAAFALTFAIPGMIDESEVQIDHFLKIIRKIRTNHGSKYYFLAHAGLYYLTHNINQKKDSLIWKHSSKYIKHIFVEFKALVSQMFAKGDIMHIYRLDTAASQFTGKEFQDYSALMSRLLKAFVDTQLELFTTGNNKLDIELKSPGMKTLCSKYYTTILDQLPTLETDIPDEVSANITLIVDKNGTPMTQEAIEELKQECAKLLQIGSDNMFAAFNEVKYFAASLQSLQKLVNVLKEKYKVIPLSEMNKLIAGLCLVLDRFILEVFKADCSDNLTRSFIDLMKETLSLSMDTDSRITLLNAIRMSVVKLMSYNDCLALAAAFNSRDLGINELQLLIKGLLKIYPEIDSKAFLSVASGVCVFMRSQKESDPPLRVLAKSRFGHNRLLAIALLLITNTTETYQKDFETSFKDIYECALHIISRKKLSKVMYSDTVKVEDGLPDPKEVIRGFEQTVKTCIIATIVEKKKQKDEGKQQKDEG